MRTWKQGRIGELQISKTIVVYTKCLVFPLLQIYKEYNPATGILSNLLFEVWVHKSILKNINKIAESVLSNSDLKPRKFYKVGIITKEISIYTNGIEIPSTLNDIRNLECAAVWEYEHIVERVISEFEGKESKFKKSLERGIFG